MILHLGWLEMIGLLNFLLVFGKGWSGDPLPISIWTKLNSFEYPAQTKLWADIPFPSSPWMWRVGLISNACISWLAFLYCIARHSSVGLSESFWAVLIACEEIKAGFSFIYAMTCVDEEFWVSCPPSLNRSKTYHGVRQLISTHDLPRLKGLLFDFCTWRHVFAKALLIIQILQKAEGLSTHKHTADGSLFDRCIGDCPFSDDSCIEIWWNKILFEFNWVEGSPLHQNNLAKQPTLPAKMCIAAHREKHGSDCARRRLGKTWVIRRLLDKLKMATGIGFSMTRICTLSSSILDFGRNHNHRILGMLRED